MRYFTKQLWAEINDENEAVRMQAEKQWELNSHAYQLEFDSIKKLLSRNFLKEFLCRNGLHDYLILEMSVRKKGRKYFCEMKLTDGLETVVLVMNELQAFSINVESFKHCIMGELAWGYSEFALTEDHNISLSLLCDFQNEQYFQFRSLTLTQVDN